ncbi:hypothetical protein ACW2Q0_30895 [Nocardia sp. R16R-3T]
MSASDRLMGLIIARLAEVLVAEGFARCQALDGKGEAQPGKQYPSWRAAWFAATDSGVSGVTAAIEAHLLRSNDGSIGVSGRTWLTSNAVAQVRAELPSEALDSAAQSGVPACVETVPFGHFQYPRDVGMATIWIAVESDVDYRVDRFMDSVRGPVRQWFTQRASLINLLALAPKPKPTSPDRFNPDPVRLRGVVILALLEGRSQEAASLMDWYRQREQFNTWDSPGRVAAFDAAMSTRFPDYGAERHGCIAGPFRAST